MVELRIVSYMPSAAKANFDQIVGPLWRHKSHGKWYHPEPDVIRAMESARNFEGA